MKKKLFGQNINPDCAYCENSVNEHEAIYCKKSKQIHNGKCKAFRYDPLLRVPKTSHFKSNFSADDFKL